MAGPSGWRLYRNSLVLVFFVLFAVSLLQHAYGGEKNEGIGTLAYMGTSKFWFRSRTGRASS